MTLQYHKNQNKKHFVTVDEVITETTFVDKLQKLVDYANANVLRSFKLNSNYKRKSIHNDPRYR